VKRFVRTSSFFVHGTSPGPECAREDSATIRRHGNSYADSKAEGEEIVRRAIQRDGLPAIILRPTVVFGPYSAFVPDVVQAAKSGEFGLLDDGRGVCNAVFVDDVCSALHTALTADTALGEAFFLNADKAVTWRDFNTTFARMARPDVTFRDFKSAGIQPRLDSQRATIGTNFRALKQLIASPDFHRQPSTVPAVGWALFHTKELVKKSLSGETVADIKRARAASASPSAASAATSAKWPEGGRLVRECCSVEFSNEKARRVLGWRPAFTFEQGAAMTRVWLEFARYNAAGE